MIGGRDQRQTRDLCVYLSLPDKRKRKEEEVAAARQRQREAVTQDITDFRLERPLNSNSPQSEVVNLENREL